MLFIGTSGWQYGHWKRRFYPREAFGDELSFYAGAFSTVELNNSFYRLPEASTFKKWKAATPDDFTFAVKASRYLTHIKRLSEPEQPVKLLLKRAQELGEKLGPVLLQLPPTLKCDIDRLSATLDAFPASLRVAVEFRHDSWFTAEVCEVLESHNAALCLVDRKSRLVTPEWRTADWGYVRFHQGTARPHPCYGSTALRSRLSLISRLWSADEDVYVYFNNDTLGCALRDAVRFGQLARRRCHRLSRTPAVDQIEVG